METPTTFAWDEAKEATNVAKHKVTFPFATRVFADPARIVLDTTRAADGEARGKVIGMVDGKVYTVVFTVRRDVCRIISARRANRNEVRSYGNP